MKYILTGVLAVLLSISQVSAGILEYNMGQKVKTNASKEESVDAIETIQATSNAARDYRSYDNQHEGYYKYYGVNRYYNSGYKHPAVSRGGKKYTEYYYDVLNSLENDLSDVEKEREYIENVISDISKELRRYSSDNTYNRERLRDEQRYLKNRKNDLEEQEKDIKKEIKEVKKNKKYYNTRYNYSYHDRYEYPGYKYRNYYNDYYYYHRQNFVNPDLKDVKEGRIYIR